ncbi:transposase [Streptomyces sp. ME01-18a]|uniref:transposase family protein n=1 Tax=Streptomyces sp. ME01-18a TaxID=3028669 RepID=UPI0029BB11AD|nr:transposase family protein [Streptomyces sp. ME01-18a]MDX3433952.1 transposase [Streptomyces sp. ME01-18a]
MRSYSTDRGGERSEAGAKYKLVFVDRLLATLVHLRHGVIHDVLACWFQGDRSTITRAVCEIRPLLADRDCRIEGGLRLRTLADVIAHLGATGQTALMDATEVRVRRPSAHSGGRNRFISGKSRINAMKALVVTDQRGRPLFCGKESIRGGMSTAASAPLVSVCVWLDHRKQCDASS